MLQEDGTEGPQASLSSRTLHTVHSGSVMMPWGCSICKAKLHLELPTAKAAGSRDQRPAVARMALGTPPGQLHDHTLCDAHFCLMMVTKPPCRGAQGRGEELGQLRLIASEELGKPRPALSPRATAGIWKHMFPDHGVQGPLRFHKMDKLR